jgi:hypothetical protein
MHLTEPIIWDLRGDGVDDAPYASEPYDTPYDSNNNTGIILGILDIYLNIDIY